MPEAAEVHRRQAASPGSKSSAASSGARSEIAPVEKSAAEGDEVGEEEELGTKLASRGRAPS
jgi:hypothetical protein